MSDWKIAVLHPYRDTLLKRAFETAFPEIVSSIFIPQIDGLALCKREDLSNYINRRLRSLTADGKRLLTIYGSGGWHHITYALTKRALTQRGLIKRPWTYFHFDHHRDDWGSEDNRSINCANFVVGILQDHKGTPFMIGADVEPEVDLARHIYSNRFSSNTRRWNWVVPPWRSRYTLPTKRDLLETPKDSYLSFDLDLLTPADIVTDYDQSENVTLRKCLRIVDRVKRFKRVFGADILGVPDDTWHSLSVLTTVILARKVVGLRCNRLLRFHTTAKRIQAGRIDIDPENRERESPITEKELMEALKP